MPFIPACHMLGSFYYLRLSVLQSIAKRTGDEPLPLDLMTAGTFADTSPQTEKKVSDKIATMELSHRMAKRLRVIAGSGEDLYGEEEGT